MIVPKAIESATSRFGFLTSAAVKPMLFQASAENREPTWATQNATHNPNAPLAAVTVGTKLFKKFAPGSSVCGLRMVQMWLKFSLIAPAFFPTKIPRRISPTKDSVFALVKIFCISLPSRTPSVFRNVRKRIIKIPTSCCTERIRAYFDEREMGWTSQAVGETDGKRTPRYLANPTATAAIVPV